MIIQSIRLETEGIAIRKVKDYKSPPTPDGFVWILDEKTWVWSLYKIKR